MGNQLTFNEACDVLTAQLDNSGLTFGHGALDADSEALWILSYCTGITPSEAFDHLNAEYPIEALEHALEIVKQRIESKKPLAYILGEAWLMGHVFICDERSIVPRSYIAELIADEVLENWLPPGGRVLDLCTGNGSIAILLALHCPDMQIVATDIDEDALGLARQNVEKYHLSDAIELLPGDLWEALPSPNQSNLFDLILCNPPYVNSSTMEILPQEYLSEPVHALEGGVDGMRLIRTILEQAKDYLSDCGAIVLEIGNEYEHFMQAFPGLELTWLDVSAGNRKVVLVRGEDLP